MSLCASIVIRSYNEEQHIVRLHTDIMKQKIRETGVIIVARIKPLSTSTDACSLIP